MTRYFFDTEFLDDGAKITLISIALVCDDGRELYFASTEWLGNDGKPDLYPSPHVRADDWLRDNVFAKLPPCTCPDIRNWRQRPYHPVHRADCLWRSRDEIADAIRDFVRDLGEASPKPEFWAYFASYDWVCLCQLFGKMIDLPKHFPWVVNDLKTWAAHMGYVGRFKDLLPDAGHHDALADAKWNRDVHALLLKRFAERNYAFAGKLIESLDNRSRHKIQMDWAERIAKELSR